MHNYLHMLRDVLERGEPRADRTGVGTRSVFSYQLEYDLTEGFPLLTTKKLHQHSIIHELLWFLRGDTNTAYLRDNGISIWDEWADERGELGPVYGAQWRHWQTPKGGRVDQIRALIDGLIQSPQSRRHIVSAWNPGELEHMALPPCHLMFQMYVDNNQGLHCQLYQRSADIFLGVPFNIASYALLTHMVAQATGLYAKRFIWQGGDVHLYNNHLDQAREQLDRQPRTLPTLKLQPRSDIFQFTADDVEIIGYDPYPHISAPVAR